MKRVAVAVLILALTLAAAIGNGIYLSRSTGQVTALLEQAEDAAGQGEWADALALAEEAERRWMAADLYHHIVLHVDSLEDIAGGFQEVYQFLLTQDGPEAAAASGRLANKLRMTAEAEQLRLENIL